MRLFDYFDKVYCINLKKRIDRLNNFKSQVINFNLGEFELFEAVDGTLLEKQTQSLRYGEIGIIQSTIDILELSSNKNYKSILLVEDDCQFNDNIKNFDFYYKCVPTDWEMLYFGGNHNLHINVRPPSQVGIGVVKLHYTFAAHCLAIKSNMFEIILNNLKTFSVQSDVVYQKLQSKHNVYGFYPGLATQISGYSDIQNKITDYSDLLK